MSDQDALQRYVDEHVTPEALRRASRKWIDESMYGFSAVDSDGQRIDPYDLLPVEHQSTVDRYCTRSPGRSIDDTMAHFAYEWREVGDSDC